MYNVVFEYTALAGAWEGERIVRSWPTKEDFKKEYESWPEETKKSKIVGEGLAYEVAVALSEDCPRETADEPKEESVLIISLGRRGVG